MAIIIVAIILTFVAICGYIAYCLNDVREDEKGFYDILFLTKFFQEITQKGKWNTFIRKNNIIYVTRNVIITEKEIDLDALNIEKENFEVIESSENSSKSEEKNGYLWYEFKTDVEAVSLALQVSKEHINLLKFLRNTMFICSIDKNNVKMLLNGSVEKVMYISSIESVCQNLVLTLQNKETNFMEKHNWLWDFFGEVYETYNIIAQIKELLTNYKEWIT